MDPVCSCHDVTFDSGSLELFLKPERAALSTSQSVGLAKVGLQITEGHLRRVKNQGYSCPVPCPVCSQLSTAKSCSSLRELRGKNPKCGGVKVPWMVCSCPASSS